MNLNIFGGLALATMVAVGVALIMLGVRAVTKAGGLMVRGLGLLSIVVGVVYFILLAVAMLMHREPWTSMLVLLVVGIVVAGVIFWAGALADCLLNEPNEGWGKLVWVLAIILTFVIGAGIYYVGRRPRRLQQSEWRSAAPEDQRADPPISPEARSDGTADARRS